jgi:Phage integrase SAM-like domain
LSPARQFGTIRRLPSGRYQARYWNLGEQVSAGTTFPTKTEARAWLSSVETDLRRGDHVDPRAGSERFGAYSRRWLDERDLRPRTRETYESQLNWILGTFDAVQLRDINAASVRSWYGRMHKAGRSPNTVAKVYRPFRTIMSTAVDDGLLRSNPVPHAATTNVTASIARHDLTTIAFTPHEHQRFPRPAIIAGARSGRSARV